MNRIFADISMNLEQPIPNQEQLMKAEQAAADKWKVEGVLEHFFLKADKTGVILVFKDLEEDTVRDMVASLPLAGYFTHVDYLLFEKMY